MSQIDAFNPVNTAIQPSTSENRFNELTSEEFVEIIFAELTNQDPFQPNDSSALLEQLNSIRSIESDLALVDQLKSLVTENQLASGSNLIGKTITGLTDTNDRVTGVVTSVSRENEDVFLELESGQRVSMGSIETIVQE